MKTRDASRILHPDKRMKTVLSHRTRGPKPSTRFYTGLRRFSALAVFIAMLAVTFYSASSASSVRKPSRHLPGSASDSAATEGKRVVDQKAVDMKMMGATAAAAEMYRGNTFPLTASWLSPALMPQMVGESIATFASDCITPKTSFVLGDTVCVQQTGAPLSSEVQRRISWVSPDSVILKNTDVTTDPQDDTFAIPNSTTTVLDDGFSVRTLNNRGTWRVNSIAASDATLRASTFFTVSDPAQPATDLSIEVNKVGTSDAGAGGSVAFTLEVTNTGPDPAQSVELRSAVPANTTFMSITQSSGPAFTCTDPGAGNTGTTVCSITGLAKDGAATFTVIYQVGAGTPEDTVISTSATVTNSVSELRPPDNTGADTAMVGTPSCVITCPNNILMGNDQDQFGAVVNYTAPTTVGTCGTVETTPASGSFFLVGETVVVGTGSGGSPCSFTVTVEDRQDPTISCPADITTFESPSGSGSAIVNYATPLANDNDPHGATVSCSPASGSSFNVGTTPVTCTATDAAGNDATCTFNVIVEGDASACALSCPADITVNADAGSCGAVVTYTAATASTECGTVSYSKASGSVFPVGTTIVTVTTTAGRSCSFKVKVIDAQKPTITPPVDVNANAAANSCQTSLNPGTATATDNCSGVTVQGVRDDGLALNAPYPVGTTVITWTAKDGAGNTKSADQLVKVRDTVPPVVTLLPNITLAAPADSCLVEVPEVISLQSNSEGNYGTATDNCAGPELLTIRQIPAAGTLVSAGNHTITVTVYDGDPDDPEAPTPNSTTRTTVLHVTDGTPPTIALNGANPITVECHTSFTDPGATATDSCAGSFPATASGTVNVNTPGSYTITYNATDPSGNAATPVTRTVNVVDTIAPTLTLNGANPMTVECHTGFTDPGATASDACAGSLTSAITVTGSVNPNVVGSYTLTYTVSDGYNTTTATRVVNVVDTTAPTITLNGQTITFWPPNHNYRTVNVTDLVASASDGCDSTIDRNDVVISKVTSDETENGNGDGNTNNDIIIAANCKSVQLRSERDGGGDGRVYTITFKVTDAAGNVKTVTAKVTVPKSQGNGGAAVDSGPHYTVTGSCP